MRLNPYSLTLSPATRSRLQRLSFAMKRGGWPAMLGLALIFGSLAFDTWSNDAGEQQLRQLAQENRRLHQRWIAQRSADDTPTLDVDDLPRRTALDDRIAALHRLAQAHHLRLDQGEYRIERASSSRIERCRIAFPAHGSYPDLRDWLAAIAEHDAGTIVEGLTLKRPDVGSEGLEMRIQLALLERGE